MANPNYPFGRNWRGGFGWLVIVLIIAGIAQAGKALGVWG